jgi:glycosyltransferase 2 family protein
MLNMKGGTYFKAIGLVLFAVILYHVDLEEVWRQLKLSDPFLVAAAVLLILPQVALRAFRWQKMLARQTIYCPFRFALSFYFAGIYIGLMTPGRLGEIAKAFFLKQSGLASLSQSMPSIIVDRCLDLYCLLMFAVISLYPLGLGLQSPMVAGIICIALGVTPWLVLYFWRSSGLPISIRNSISSRLSTKWVETFESFNAVVEQLVSRQVVFMLLITVASYGIYFLQTYLIGRSVGLDIGFSAIAMIVSIAILVGFIPVTIAGLGTREAVFIFLFGRFGISSASALSFAFLYNLVYIACVGIISAIFWMRLPNRQELKNVQKELG